MCLLKYKNILECSIGIEKNDFSRTIYEGTNAFIEKWTKIMNFVFVKVTLTYIAGPYLFLSYFRYFTTDLKSEAFYLPFLLWYIDFIIFKSNHNAHCCCAFTCSRTPPITGPFVYFVIFALGMAPYYYIFTQCTCCAVYPAGSCCILIAFATDIKAEMMGLNELCIENTDKLKFSQQFGEFVKFHSTVLQ